MPAEQTAAPDGAALRVALWRALHAQIDAPPYVLQDEIGLLLAAPNDDWRQRPDMDPKATGRARASVVARARFIEDLVIEQANHGVGQYLILGAGLSGLSAALQLAGRGRQVTVVERYGFPGGRMGQADVRGYRIDTGPTVLTMPDILIASGVIPGSFGSHFNEGLLALALTLAAILLRRFVAGHTRTLRLQIEHKLAKQRIAEQSALLLAAARMAKGELEQKIEVAATSPLAPLATALDDMRQDLQAKLELLQHAERPARAGRDAGEPQPGD